VIFLLKEKPIADNDIRLKDILPIASFAPKLGAFLKDKRPIPDIKPNASLSAALNPFSIASIFQSLCFLILFILSSILLDIDVGIVEVEVEGGVVITGTLLSLVEVDIGFILFDSISSFKFNPKSIPKNINILINILNFNNNSINNVLFILIIIII
jgi:hypothetical protein